MSARRRAARRLDHAAGAALLVWRAPPRARALLTLNTARPGLGPPACARRVAMRDLNKQQAKLYSRMFAALGKGGAAGDAPPPADGADGAPAPMQEDAPGAGAAPAAPVVQAAA